MAIFNCYVSSPEGMGYTLWLFNIAIETGPVEIVDVPIDSMVIFDRFFVCLPGRVTVFRLVNSFCSARSSGISGCRLL